MSRWALMAVVVMVVWTEPLLGQTWRQFGDYHPECPYAFWCINVVGPMDVGIGEPGKFGLIEIQVGGWAPPFDTPQQWRISPWRTSPVADPYLAVAHLRVRKRDCGSDPLLLVGGGNLQDCILTILPGQVSSMHDRRGRPKKKRALKIRITDHWRPNSGFERSEIPTCRGSRFGMQIEHVSGDYGTFRAHLPVTVCR